MTLEQEALALLRQGLGKPEATFHEGQLEAIEALVARRGRLLLVRRTGWGKSIVYFIAAALRRKQGTGPTLIISPLRALMRNQLAAAQGMGLRAAHLNTDNRPEWEEVFTSIAKDELDVLLIAPERFSNAHFREEIVPTLFQRLGMLVVDEAHCISDWGHDFRPDYRRIARFTQLLPSGVPVLATTATANDSVIEDVREQLGADVQVSRGPLARASLSLDTYGQLSYAERLAWLAATLQRLERSGIVYTLTKADANLVAEWLTSHGIEALAYHNDVEDRVAREEALLANRVKALIATTALGMGFDKPDLGFVIHFQTPQSIIHYYQEVGRAGRDIDTAYGVLLSGPDDEAVIEYFIRNALPPQRLAENVLDILEKSNNGVTVRSLMAQINEPFGSIEATLKFLEVELPSPIVKVEGRYFRAAVPYAYPRTRVEQLSTRRREEHQAIVDYVKGGDCLMQTLAHSLGDTACPPCGRCSACRGGHLVHIGDLQTLTAAAEAFLNRREIRLKIPKQWPEGGLPAYGFNSGANIKAALKANEGRALTLFRVGAAGRRVRQEKYSAGHFSDETVAEAVAVIKRWNPTPKPEWIVPMVSKRRPDLVPGFARRLAAALGIPYVEALVSIGEPAEQKGMENNSFRARNLNGSLRVVPFSGMEKPGLFIDDMCDSGMTIAVAVALLRQAGAGSVFPFTLAKASGRE